MKEITPAEWARMSNGVIKETKCMHPQGTNCTAYKEGKCIALRDTRFNLSNKNVSRVCSFFRDQTKMTEEEIAEYEKLASYGDRMREVNKQKRERKKEREKGEQ